MLVTDYLLQGHGSDNFSYKVSKLLPSHIEQVVLIDWCARIGESILTIEIDGSRIIQLSRPIDAIETERLSELEYMSHTWAWEVKAEVMLILEANEGICWEDVMGEAPCFSEKQT